MNTRARFLACDAIRTSTKHKFVPLATAVLALAGASLLRGRAAEAKPVTLLCACVRDAVAKDAALRNATAAAFGKEARYQSDKATDSVDAPPCLSLAGLLHFSGADVLITAHTDGAMAGPSDIAHLSAYFLRNADGALKLVTVKRDFTDGNSGWGNAGEISQVRFGNDDGMIVRGGFSQQGYNNGTASFYVFRDGGIASLGTVPMDWGNGGAEEDDSKVVSVDAKIDTVQLQPDHVRITYTRKAAGASQSQDTIWRSENGKFVLVSGTLPREIKAIFDVASAPATAGEPPAKPAAGGGSNGAELTIEDSQLAPVLSDIAAAVKRDPDYSSTCKLKGKQILPSVSQTLLTYFVTTADACGWGAALGPIWIVSVADNGHAGVALSAGGYSVKVTGDLQNGFHNLVVGAETAGSKSADEYAYDGKVYRKKEP